MSYSLGKNILATVTYYDVLNMPLSAFEIWKHLITQEFEHPVGDTPCTLGDVARVLASGQLTQRINEQNGFYFLPGRAQHPEIRHAGEHARQAPHPLQFRGRNLLSPDALCHQRLATRQEIKPILLIDSLGQLPGSEKPGHIPERAGRIAYRMLEFLGDQVLPDLECRKRHIQDVIICHCRQDVFPQTVGHKKMENVNIKIENDNVK